jgi:hypothetical protein
MSNGERPSVAGRSPAPFLIGRNSRGNWVVQDPDGLHGGLFVDRVQALKYAMSGDSRGPRAVVMMPDGLELDLSISPKNAGSGNGRRLSEDPQHKQVA